MAVTNYDCGDLSEVVISSNGFGGTLKVVDDLNVVIGKMDMEPGMNPVTFMCSGSLNLRATFDSYHVFLSSISLQGVWSENFLMGLAGLACGFLMSYVFVKYAV
ncbi:MAG: hypothetical protein H8D23_04710 [Candidatus Brocadiales bacterium]|nr:hypothetical protein [Candidatus Brocadiales bacterium]